MGRGPSAAGPQSGRQRGNCGHRVSYLQPRAEGKKAMGRAAQACIVNDFLCYFFQSTVFVQILGKFHIVFAIQNYPLKFCLENRKVIEIFMQSLKFMNF
jgi:hypothetical protein